MFYLQNSKSKLSDIFVSTSFIVVNCITLASAAVQAWTKALMCPDRYRTARFHESFMSTFTPQASRICKANQNTEDYRRHRWRIKSAANQRRWSSHVMHG